MRKQFEAALHLLRTLSCILGQASGNEGETMRLEYGIEGNRCIIRVSGDLVFQNNKEWRNICELALEEPAELCVLDLCGLESIDSAGLGMILALRTWVERQNMSLRLRYIDDNFVGSMMRLVKFDSMLLKDES